MSTDHWDLVLPPSEHLKAGAGAQDLPLFAAQAADRAAQSGVGYRHYLHPDGQGFRLSRCHRRLVQPQGFGLAGVDFDGSRFLH